MSESLIERLRAFAEDTHPSKNTHLINWLESGYTHSQHGGREWTQGYLDSAREYILAFEAIAAEIVAAASFQPIGYLNRGDAASMQSVINNDPLICALYSQFVKGRLPVFALPIDIHNNYKTGVDTLTQQLKDSQEELQSVRASFGAVADFVERHWKGAGLPLHHDWIIRELSRWAENLDTAQDRVEELENTRSIKAVPSERLRRYAAAGINPLDPNPDGSDWHIMNAIDDDLVAESGLPREEWLKKEFASNAKFVKTGQEFLRSVAIDERLLIEYPILFKQVDAFQDISMNYAQHAFTYLERMKLSNEQTVGCLAQTIWEAMRYAVLSSVPTKAETVTLIAELQKASQQSDDLYQRAAQTLQTFAADTPAQRKYFVFAGDTHYPIGGFNDFRGAYTTQEVAVARALACIKDKNIVQFPNEDFMGWWQVVFVENGRAVIVADDDNLEEDYHKVPEVDYDEVPEINYRDWQTDMSTAPRDRVIEVVGRLPTASAGFPQYAIWYDVEKSFCTHSYNRPPQAIVVWAWRERTDWPQERLPHE